MTLHHDERRVSSRCKKSAEKASVMFRRHEHGLLMPFREISAVLWDSFENELYIISRDAARPRATGEQKYNAVLVVFSGLNRVGIHDISISWVLPSCSVLGF